MVAIGCEVVEALVCSFGLRGTALEVIWVIEGFVGHGDPATQNSRVIVNSDFVASNWALLKFSPVQTRIKNIARKSKP